jgi:fucose permease
MPVSSRRTLVLITAMGMTLHGAVFSFIGPMLPSIMETFRIQEAQAGLLLASSPGGFLLGTVGGGFLIDLRGLKSAYMLGMVGEVLALGLYAVAPTFSVTMAAGLVLGLGSGIIESTLNTLPSRISAPNQMRPGRRQASSLMNLVHLYFSLGAFIAPLIIGALLGRGWLWRTIYGAYVIPVLAMGLAVMAVQFPSAPSEPVTGGSRDPDMNQTAWTLLRQRPVILGALVLLFYVGAELGIAAWVVLYLQQELHLSVGLASAGLSTFWLAMMVGRYGNSHLALRLSERDLLIASGVGGAVCCWGLLTTGNTLVAFGWLVLIGLLSAGVYPLAMASVNSRYPRFAGRVSGLLAAGAGSGALLFPPLLGAVAQGTSLRLAMGLNGVWMLGVAVSFAFMPRETHFLRTEADTGG